MTRPSTITGLVRLLARRRPAAAAGVGVGLVAAAFGVLAVVPKAAPTCSLTETDWQYGDWKYDYLERFAVDREGTGSYVLGYAQAVREDITFSYRTEADTLRMFDIVEQFDGRHRPREGEIRTRFMIEEGDFRFESDNPYEEP